MTAMRFGLWQRSISMFRDIQSIRTCLLLCSLAYAAAEAQAQQVLLWKLKPGERLHYTRSLSQKSRLGDGPERRHSNVEEGIWSVLQVEPDGTARITQTLNRIQGIMPGWKDEVVAEREEFTFDTDQTYPPDSAPGRVVRGKMLKVGSEFSFTLTPLGEVRDVSLSESTRKRLAERPAAGRGFSDDALRSSIPAAPLPRGELKPGQSWTEKPTFIDSFFFPTRVLATKYRYAGPIERDGSRLDVIELEFESDLTPAHEPPY